MPIFDPFTDSAAIQGSAMLTMGDGAVSLPGGQSYANFIASIGAVLFFDGTLNGSNIKNLGSLGAAGDGTPTDVTIDANGMNFNGTTSKIDVPALTGYNNLATYTLMMDLNPAGAGEGNAGHLITTDAGTGRVWRINSASLPFNFFHTSSGTAASSLTANSFVATSTRQLFFVTFDNAGDRKARIYKIPAAGVLTEATYVTQDAMTGTIALPTAALCVGNRAAQTFTLNGVIGRGGAGIFNNVLSAAQMNEIARLAGLIS